MYLLAAFSLPPFSLCKPATFLLSFYFYRRFISFFLAFLIILTHNFAPVFLLFCFFFSPLVYSSKFSHSQECLFWFVNPSALPNFLRDFCISLHVHVSHLLDTFGFSSCPKRNVLILCCLLTGLTSAILGLYLLLYI